MFITGSNAKLHSSELLKVRNRRNYIQNLFDSIMPRDIQQRFKVHYIGALLKLANHLVDNFLQEIIYTDLAFVGDREQSLIGESLGCGLE